jgi:zinc protease
VRKRKRTAITRIMSTTVPTPTAAFSVLYIFLSIFIYPFVCLCAEVRSDIRPVSTFRLPNGLRVILAPVNNIEATGVMLYHLTGVRDDPAEIRGASYLYQNLMLAGTKNLDAYDRVFFIKRNGGLSDRIVNYDYSIFYQVIPESEVDNALWLESERISSLKLTDRNITIEKNTIYNRNYKLLNSDVHFRAMAWIKSRLLQGTPYEIPIYGSLEDIKGFDNQSIKKLYYNFTDLSRIIMVVSGKFNLEELKKSINKHFVPLSSPELPSEILPKKQSASNSNTKYKYTYENWVIENLSEPFILYGIRGPARYSLDYIYFDFLRCYLVDERISVLEGTLNHTYGLDVTVTYEFTDYYDSNALIIKISAKQRENLEKAKYLVLKKLEALGKSRTGGSISASDFKTTKTLMEIDFLKNMTVLEKRSAFLAEHYHLSGSLNAEDVYLNRIRKINIYDIYRISQKYLDKDNLVNLNVYAKTKTK